MIIFTKLAYRPKCVSEIGSEPLCRKGLEGFKSGVAEFCGQPKCVSETGLDTLRQQAWDGFKSGCPKDSMKFPCAPDTGRRCRPANNPIESRDAHIHDMPRHHRGLDPLRRTRAGLLVAPPIGLQPRYACPGSGLTRRGVSMTRGRRARFCIN